MSRTRVTVWIHRLARVPNVVARLSESGRKEPDSESRATGRVRRARRAVWVFPLAALVLHLATVGAMEAWPQLRDPEYGRRAERLRERVAQHPDRPLVLVFGSSRVSMGVRPAAWEEARPGSPADPLLFNMSEFGAGPIVQLILVRRVFADGFRPDVVVLEYWPPVLRQHDGHGDTTRFDQHRLRWDDRPVVRDYYPNPEAVERRMRSFRLNPLTENGARLLVQLDSRWVPGSVQSDKGWAEMDGWGWAPGMDVRPDDAATRRKLTDHIRVPFAAQLAGCTIHPDSDRALRASIAVARQHGARVAFVFMPESAEFQSRYPADLERTAREHLARLSAELAVPVIPARDWMDERYLADGFHLSRAGAAVFTAKLGPAIAETFRREANRDR